MVSSCIGAVIGSAGRGNGWCKLRGPPDEGPGTYCFTN